MRFEDIDVKFERKKEMDNLKSNGGVERWKMAMLIMFIRIGCTIARGAVYQSFKLGLRLNNPVA